MIDPSSDLQPLCASDDEALPEGDLVQRLADPEGVVVEQAAVQHQLHLAARHRGPALTAVRQDGHLGCLFNGVVRFQGSNLFTDMYLILTWTYFKFSN